MELKMNNTTVDKYQFEDQPFITYEEAGSVLGIAATSVVGFATDNGVTRGQVTIRGRQRGVLKTDEFYKVVRDKNYFGDQPVDVVWNK